MASRWLTAGALSFVVVLTACQSLDSSMITELPTPAANAPKCAGSTLSEGASTAKQIAPALPKQPASSAGSFGLVFTTPSKADPTATSIDTVQPDGSRLREIAHGFFDAENPVVAPDRRSVAYQIDRGGLSGPELHVVDVTGVKDRKLYKADRYLTGITWSPDSKEVAFLSDDHLKIVAARGGSVKSVADHGHALPDVSSDHAAWSPRGDWIAFTDSANLDPTLVLIHPDGTGREDLAAIEYSGPIAWAPDGSQIAFLNRGLSMVQPDGKRLRHLVATPEGTSIASVSWSPDGQFIIYEGGPQDPDDTTVCAVSVSGSGLSHLGDCTYEQDAVAWSPDSRLVTFPQMDDPACPRDGTWHLQFIDIRTQQAWHIPEPSRVQGEVSWVVTS